MSFEGPELLVVFEIVEQSDAVREACRKLSSQVADDNYGEPASWAPPHFLEAGTWGPGEAIEIPESVEGFVVEVVNFTTWSDDDKKV